MLAFVDSSLVFLFAFISIVSIDGTVVQTCYNMSNVIEGKIEGRIGRCQRTVIIVSVQLFPRSIDFLSFLYRNLFDIHIKIFI